MNLVTGATGILGSHILLKLLLEQKPVMALKQKNSDIQKVKRLFSYYTKDADSLFEKIKWIEGNVCDIFSFEEALEEAAAVFHCAGFVSFDKRERKKLFTINEQGTANVVNACLRKNIPLCHVSSIATLHNLDYNSELTEEVFWKRSGRESDYAISKYNAEREVWRGIEEGLKAVIVNPGVILSPGFWNQSSSKMFTTCHKGNLFYTDGNAGYVAAEDVADAMIRLMEKRLYGNRYILVEGNYTFKNIFDQIQSGFNKTKPFINASRFTLHLGRIADGIVSGITGRERVLTKALINSALNRQTLSNKKIKATINMEFQPVNHVISRICGIYLEEVKAKRL